MKKPPLWLAAACVASAWAALYSVARWILYFVQHPIHEDLRLLYVASQAGLRFGWSTIYDQGTLRALSTSFPPADRTIDKVLTYLHPPLLAWLFAPLTVFPEPVAYVIWTVLSLAAFVFAWHVAAPYEGVAKITLLLAALGLWPVMQAFYYGQPTFLVIALIAGSWWLGRRERMSAAGVALAFATVLKPQVIFMLPLCLLVAGRFRLLFGWAVPGAVLAAISALALGPSGLTSYWEAIKLGQTDVGHIFFTDAYLFGLRLGPPTYTLLALQGVAVLFLAFRRRDDLDLVFVAGLLGSIMVSIHLHQPDYANLALAAWLALRGAPSLAHKLWLALGIVTMQVLTLGQPIPQLIWDIGWLAVLVASTFAQKRVPSRIASPIPVRP